MFKKVNKASSTMYYKCTICIDNTGSLEHRSLVLCLRTRGRAEQLIFKFLEVRLYIIALRDADPLISYLNRLVMIIKVNH